MGTTDREERLNKAPHFLYHYDMKKHKLHHVQKLEGQVSQKRNIFLL
jgi:hypothetical protein